MHKEGKAQLIPVILRPSMWNKNSDLSELQALPTDAKPITKWDDADEAWLDVVQGLNTVITTFQPVEIMKTNKIIDSEEISV
jgi:hypothetical protein